MTARFQGPLDRTIAALPLARHPLAILGATLVGAALVAALLGPPVWAGLIALVTKYPDLRPSHNLSLVRIVQRLVLIGLLVGFLSTARRSYSLPLLRDGFERIPGWRLHLIAGLLYALASIALLHGAWLVCGLTVFQPWSHLDAGKIARTVPKALVTAGLVGLIEEFFFRGIIHRCLRGWFPLWLAVGVSSALFAATHFLAVKPAAWDDTANTFLSGFVALGTIAAGLADGPVPMRALGLFLLGIVLALAYERSGKLYLPFALHAGWVFLVRCDGMFVRFATENRLWTGGSMTIDGFAGQLMLLCSAGIVWWLGDQLAKRSQPPPPVPRVSEHQSLDRLNSRIRSGRVPSAQ